MGMRPTLSKMPSVQEPSAIVNSVVSYGCGEDGGGREQEGLSFSIRLCTTPTNVSLVMTLTTRPPVNCQIWLFDHSALSHH